MSQGSLLISQITIAEPVVNTAADTVWIRSVAISASVVNVSVTATATVRVATAAEQPVERVKDRNVNACTGGRCHGAYQSDRQKQCSDLESHIGFLGETERTAEATKGSGECLLETTSRSESQGR